LTDPFGREGRGERRAFPKVWRASTRGITDFLAIGVTGLHPAVQHSPPCTATTSLRVLPPLPTTTNHWPLTWRGGSIVCLARVFSQPTRKSLAQHTTPQRNDSAQWTTAVDPQLSPLLCFEQACQQAVASERVSVRVTETCAAARVTKSPFRVVRDQPLEQRFCERHGVDS
jgi:hypothetical protein